MFVACSVGHKHWFFASSWRLLQAVASLCHHPITEPVDIRAVQPAFVGLGTRNRFVLDKVLAMLPVNLHTDLQSRQ